MKMLFYVLFYPIVLIYKMFFHIKSKHFFKCVTIEKVDTLSGRDFEEFVELVFKYCGFKTTLTQVSSDYGADVIAVKHGAKIVVQTKLYYNHQVGSASVQEVSSAQCYYKADYACVVTNWKFSNQAKNLANAQNVLLVDRQNLIDFLNNVKNNKKDKFFCGLVKQFKTLTQN